MCDLTVTPDFAVMNCGSVWRFTPITDVAREFAESIGLEGWQWMGSSFCVDHRPALDLIEVI